MSKMHRGGLTDKRARGSAISIPVTSAARSVWWGRGFLALTALLGAFGAGWLVWRSGWPAIAASLERGGIGLLWLIPLRIVTVAVEARGWYVLLRARRQAPWAVLIWLAMVRDAINTFLPVARVGGEFAAIRALWLRGVKISTASAAIIVETSVTLVLQVLLTLAGIIVLLPDIGATFLIPELSAVLVVAALMVGAFLMVQIRIGLVAAFDRTLGRVLRFMGYAGHSGLPGLDQKVLLLYRRGGLLFRCAGWQILGFVGGAAEIGLMAHLMGVSLDLSQIFVLESLIQAVHSVSFMVPGSLGVQEAGFVLLAGPLGLSADVALSLALARRMRQVVMGLPILGSWQWFEWRHRGLSSVPPVVVSRS